MADTPSRRAQERLRFSFAQMSAAARVAAALVVVAVIWAAVLVLL